MIINWKTSLAGLGAFITIAYPHVILLFDNDAATNPDWNIVVGAAIVFFGALFARDADKSSEDMKLRR